MDPGNESQQIEAQDSSDAQSDNDSGFGEGTPSTASLTSSIFDYEEEHGRSYHAFRRGKYVMPNDEREQERMDIHYHSIRMCMHDKLFLSPAQKPTAILDIGTGIFISRREEDIERWLICLFCF